MSEQTTSKYPKEGMQLPETGEDKFFEVKYSERRAHGWCPYKEIVKAKSLSKAEGMFICYSKVSAKEVTKEEIALSTIDRIVDIMKDDHSIQADAVRREVSEVKKLLGI